TRPKEIPCSFVRFGLAKATCRNSPLQKRLRPGRRMDMEAGISIVTFQFKHTLLAHPVRLDDQFPADHLEVRGERVGGELLEDAQRGDRAPVIADQGPRELEPDP